jgi:nucleoside-diphosphate-sugar epimerase
MRVLIVGGTSFIGPLLVRRLIALGHEVAVFHRGQSHGDLPAGVEHILGDRHDLGKHADAFCRLAPDIVVDMIAFTEADALDLVETFRGLARRTVVISSADVYRAYGRFLGIEPGSIEPTPLTEESPLREVFFPYRSQAKGSDDFLFSYDKIPVERVVLGDPDDRYNRLSPYLKRMDDKRPAIVLDEATARWKCPRGYVEDVAAAIALAIVDDRAAANVYNVSEPVAFTEAEWVRKIGEVVGWRGEIVTVPAGRIPLPCRMEQSLDTESGRIRRELGFNEATSPPEGLERTIAWERANPSNAPQGIGLLDYDAEDALLAEIGLGHHREG